MANSRSEGPSGNGIDKAAGQTEAIDSAQDSTQRPSSAPQPHDNAVFLRQNELRTQMDDLLGGPAQPEDVVSAFGIMAIENGELRTIAKTAKECKIPSGFIEEKITSSSNSMDYYRSLSQLVLLIIYHIKKLQAKGTNSTMASPIFAAKKDFKEEAIKTAGNIFQQEGGLEKLERFSERLQEYMLQLSKKV